jgi:hypothetical protein
LRTEHKIDYHPPGGVVDRHAWHQLLESVKDRTSSFSGGEPALAASPSPITPIDRDAAVRRVVSITAGRLGVMISQQSGDLEQARQILNEAVAALSQLT